MFTLWFYVILLWWTCIFWTTEYIFILSSSPQLAVVPAALYTTENKLATFSCLFDSLLSSGVTAVIYLGPVVPRQANTAAQRQGSLRRRLLLHFVAFLRLWPVVSSPWLDNIILLWHPVGEKKSFWLIKKPLSAPRARLVISSLWVIRRKWKLHCGSAPSTHITICRWTEQARKSLHSKAQMFSPSYFCIVYASDLQKTQDKPTLLSADPLVICS